MSRKAPSVHGGCPAGTGDSGEAGLTRTCRTNLLAPFLPRLEHAVSLLSEAGTAPSARSAASGTRSCTSEGITPHRA